MTAMKNIRRFAINRVLNRISKNPEKNIPKLLKLFDKLRGQDLNDVSETLHKIFDNPQNIWNRFTVDIFKDIDGKVLKTIFKNFIVNANIIGGQKQETNRTALECNIPWAILIDPTSACNLRCTGCWAAEYGNKLNMPYETLNDIIKQGKELGTFIYLYSGGEPLTRKDDIISLCKEHPDCQFAAFTNGTFIDEDFADTILEAKNFIPIISVEGFEKDTDYRRGKGVFKKVEKALAVLKAKHLPFGLSCCYTGKNVEMIGSEEYFDQIIEWGAKFCWFFTYIPLGKNAAPELIATAEQREFMYRQVRKYRETKPLFTLDFWNDGEYSDGCIAAGRKYLHINANGDMEPCAFIHYSDSNIYKNTLREALQSPLFMTYRKGQPFNENHLRPCPLLDNPDALVEIIESSGARSTDMQNPEDVRELTKKCRPAARDWAEAADKLWECRDCACGEKPQPQTE